MRKTLDSRDSTKEPPAMLDPESVLRNRARTLEFLKSGRVMWPRGADWIQIRDWVSV